MGIIKKKIALLEKKVFCAAILAVLLASIIANTFITILFRTLDNPTSTNTKILTISLIVLLGIIFYLLREAKR